MVSDQGTTLRGSDLHNAQATILNPFNIAYVTILGRKVDSNGDFPITYALGEDRQFSLQNMFTSYPFNSVIV